MSDNRPTANNELLHTLHELIGNWEHEVVEFKQASKGFSQHDIGKYFSAISNEARLKGLQHGWLVFGVHNKTREVVNTDYRDKQGLEALKHEIADNTTGGITFSDVHEVFKGDRRVIMFKIPASATGIPTAWKGHYYGREGESLGPLSLIELDRLRGSARFDWSSQVISRSSIKHLDKEAIQTARENYKTKQNREHISSEINSMSDEEFLTKLRLIVDGKLTNAAMVLLGNPDHDNIIGAPVRIMWRLYGGSRLVKDYFEFRIPYINVVDKAYSKVRNLIYRYLPNRKTLFTTEIQQYDTGLIKELLNNCIAHMSYIIGGRIYIDEFDDTIVISNPGNFIPGDIRNVLSREYRAPYYRNQLLADAMKDFDMIDTVQMGILRVFNIMRERQFPLPDYELSNPNEVSVRVFGKIIDQYYTYMLYDRSDLDIETVFMLDRVQKKLPLDKGQYKQLKKLGVIEGKYPNIYVSLGVEGITGDKEQYTKNKAMNDKYYVDLIVNYLEQFGSGTKADITKLLSDKLSDVLDDKQKEKKVNNLLTSMKRKELIAYDGNTRRNGKWVLTKIKEN